MGWLAGLSVGVLLLLAVGCGGGDRDDLGGTPGEIESAVDKGCEGDVVRSEIPADSGYSPLQELGETSVSIHCSERPRRSGVYARFSSQARLNRALRRSAAPGSLPQRICVADREVFNALPDELRIPDTTERLCKGSGGRLVGVNNRPVPAHAGSRTYDPHSGQTWSLTFKPRLWTNGGTAGSDNLNVSAWVRWGRREALAVGTSGLRGPCFNSPSCGEDAYYQAPARVELDRPRPCFAQGVTVRYFSRARFTVYMRPGNPFDEPVGWLTRTHTTRGGTCIV